MSELQIARARRLRKKMTDAERRLWQGLRGRQTGARFRRQSPIGPYIVDFVAFDHRLVVELDGGQHAEPEQAAHDQRRTAFLKGEGFRVLRFWNNEVLGNTEGVLESILAAVHKRKVPLPLPHAGSRSTRVELDRSVPSPLMGEGQDGGVKMLWGSKTR